MPGALESGTPLNQNSTFYDIIGCVLGPMCAAGSLRKSDPSQRKSIFAEIWDMAQLFFWDPSQSKCNFSRIWNKKSSSHNPRALRHAQCHRQISRLGNHISWLGIWPRVQPGECVSTANIEVSYGVQRRISRLEGGLVWYHTVPYGTIRYLMVAYGTIWYHKVP